MQDRPTTLGECFEALELALQQMISLLDEAGDTFWIAYLKRGLHQIKKRHLSGATFVLGCYGGVDTFSDVTLAQHLQDEQPLAYNNLNARFAQLRDEIFYLADAIASRKHW